MKNHLSKINASGIVKILFYLLLLTGVLLLWQLFNYFQWPASYAVALIWIVTVLVLLWAGNRYIFYLLDKILPWMKHTSKRFFWQLFLSIFYSLFCINLTYYLFKISTSETAPDAEQLLVLNIYGLLFIIPILSLNFGFYFMMQWKKAQIQSDQLKEESLNSRLEALRMHIDPHFLFNNLNVLSALIEQKPETAQHFLDRFVDVYRYVLQYKKEELVNVHTELAFIVSYIYLLKKRFGEQCIIKLNIDSGLPENRCIPPLSLQMLVENAIKHNRISLEQPLIIEIFIKDYNMIVVRNNYQPKEQFKSSLNPSGLENIRKRYQYLSEQAILIEQNNEYFTVSLPLLEIEED